MKEETIIDIDGPKEFKAVIISTLMDAINVVKKKTPVANEEMPLKQANRNSGIEYIPEAFSPIIGNNIFIGI